MTLEIFTNQISELNERLIHLAENSCTNVFSTNYQYILSEIDIHESGNVFEQTEKRIKANSRKVPGSLESVCSILYERILDLYDVNLFVYRAESTRTIIDVRFVLKSSFDPDYRNTIIKNPPMFHAKIGIPPSHEIDKKFDVNWESDSIIK